MEEQHGALRWLTIVDVEHYYVHLATGFAIGAINSEAFRMAMEAFKFRDDAHRYWTIGASSGQWYVFEGNTWTPADPPAELLGPDVPLIRMPDDLLASTLENDLPERPVPNALDPDLPDLPRMPEAMAVLQPVPAPLLCRACGGELEAGGAFCPACGARVD